LRSDESGTCAGAGRQVHDRCGLPRQRVGDDVREHLADERRREAQLARGRLGSVQHLALAPGVAQAGQRGALRLPDAADQLEALADQAHDLGVQPVEGLSQLVQALALVPMHDAVLSCRSRCGRSPGPDGQARTRSPAPSPPLSTFGLRAQAAAVRNVRTPTRGAGCSSCAIVSSYDVREEVPIERERVLVVGRHIRSLRR
jgi:hypothetical protein